MSQSEDCIPCAVGVHDECFLLTGWVKDCWCDTCDEGVYPEPASADWSWFSIIFMALALMLVY